MGFLMNLITHELHVPGSGSRSICFARGCSIEKLAECIGGRWHPSSYLTFDACEAELRAPERSEYFLVVGNILVEVFPILSDPQMILCPKSVPLLQASVQ